MFYGRLKDEMARLGGMDPEGIILAFAGGSWQHGARLSDTADLDVCGVFVGRPEEELHLDSENPRKRGHVSTSTAPDSRRNTGKDKDVKAYSLRRWAGLALKGNPTALSFLFVPDAIRDMSLTPKREFTCPYDEQQCEHPGCINWDSHRYDPECAERYRKAPTATVWDTDIVPNTGEFLSKALKDSFVGMGDGQFKRMLGEGTGRHGTRKAQQEEFGYDAKAGMHMIRSMHECLELLRTGHMTFPRPERQLLLDIRTGKVGLADVLDLYGQLRAEVAAAVMASPLPPRCDREKVSRIVAGAMLKHWRQRGWV